MIKKICKYILLILIVISTIVSCKKTFLENEITITYNANGGSGTTPNSLITLPENYVTIANSNSISKIGHQFLGWSADRLATKATYKVGQKILFTKSTTLYAIWDPDEHTIYYNPNGGNGTIFSQIIYYGIKTKTSDGKNFTKTHYYLSAWDTKADSSGTRYVAGDSAIFTIDDTLYAVWSPKTYKITYNVNGGIGSLTQDFLYGNLVSLSDGSAFSKTGHSLKGWCKNSTDTILTYSLSGSASFVSDTTLYALWKPNTYRITYNANSGSGTIASQSFVYGNSVNLSNGNGFSKTNYTFKGWNTKADLTGTTYSSGTAYSSASDILLYAIWETNILVSYDPNGGSGTIPADTTTNLDSLTLKTGSGFIKEGHKVSAWNTKADLTGITYPIKQKVKFGSDITLYAVWSLATYTITYNANSNEGTQSYTQSFVYGNPVALFDGSAFSKTGYSLKGWAKKSTDTDIAYSAGGSASFVSDTTLYAIWVGNKYTITYNANEGSETSPQTQEFTYGVSTTLNNGSAFSRTGYTLSSWNTKADGTGTKYDLNSSTTINTYNNIILYAIWTVNKYIITYANNNGNGSIPSLEFTYGSPTTLNDGSAFSRTHYTLSSWNTKADGTGTNYTLGSLAEINVPNNFSLYAIWIGNTYTIFYNANTGSGNIPIQKFTYGVSTTLNAGTSFSKTGYTLKGWGKTYTDTDISYALSGSAFFASDTTLYAIWTGNTHKITYNANEGTGTNFDQPFVYGSSTTLNNGSAFSRTGYTLTSWNTKADGTGTSYEYGKPAIINIDNDFTIYAIWTINKHIINYANNNGNGSIPAQPFTYGASTNLNNGSAFSRIGYTLSSWNTKADSTGTKYELGSPATFNIDNDFTLYAIWTANKYTITYNANAGSGSLTQEFTYEASTILNNGSAFSRTHYTLSSWNTKADGTGTNYTLGSSNIINVPNNFTLYAIWTANKYTITYNSSGGVGTLPNSDIVTVENPHTIGNGNTLTKLGYGFLGWSTNSSASSAQYNPGQHITFYSNTILYAVWGVVTCTITFNDNGASYIETPIPGPIYFQSSGEYITIPMYNVPPHYVMTKTTGNFPGYNDYIFWGWTTEEYKDNFNHVTMPSYFPGSTYKFYKSMTLYAAWRIEGAMIIYNNNGGLGSMANSFASSIYTIREAVVSNNTFTKAGYTFLTWNTKADGSGVSYTPGVKYEFHIRPITLYAIWMANN